MVEHWALRCWRGSLLGRQEGTLSPKGHQKRVPTAWFDLRLYLLHAVFLQATAEFN